MHTQNVIVHLEPEANAVNTVLMASSIVQCVYITLCQFKILAVMLKPSRFRSFKFMMFVVALFPLIKTLNFSFCKIRNLICHLKRAFVSFPGGTMLGGFLMSDQRKTQQQLARLVVRKERLIKTK